MTGFIDKKFKKMPGRYLAQCLLVVILLIVILSFLDVINETALIASLGATAFTIFSMPSSYMSAPRTVIGGYAVGMLSGVIFWYLSGREIISVTLPADYIPAVFAAIAVGVSILVMVVTNTEHAPAAGIALGLVLNSWNGGTLLFTLAAAIVMSVTKEVLSDYLVDLL
ncbi:MAG: HPP family protein [Elusimicrobia bacterium]|jgi:CBS-domain-containing membrane protein|nr:HPP family protein [Elusimicrobiota bacterium]